QRAEPARRRVLLAVRPHGHGARRGDRARCAALGGRRGAGSGLMGFGADSVALAPGLRRLVGAADQLVTVTKAVLDEGPGWGSPILTVRNPGGISFDVLLDRAMDIGWADAVGVPLAWRSPRGPVSSARYEPQGAGWVRTFAGGLLSTCGL